MMAAPDSAPFTRRLVVGIILLNLIVAVLAGLSVEQGYRYHRDQAAVQSRNLAQALDQNMESVLGRVDLALTAFADEFHRRPPPPSEMQLSLLATSVRVPDIDSVGMTAADGTILAWSGGTGFSSATIGDRDYFAVLRDNPRAGLVISKPVRGRITGRWQVVLARRLDLADNSFGGAVYAVVLLDHLGAMFSRLDLGPHGAAVMFGPDFVLLARHPALTDNDGIGRTTVSPQFRRMVAANPAEGTYEARTGLDNILRTVSYRKVGAYPLTVAAGLAADDYLTAWWADLVKLALLVAAFMLTTVLLFRLVRQSWRQTEATRTRLEAILRNTPIGLAIVGDDRVIEISNAAAAEIFAVAEGDLAGHPVSAVFGRPAQFTAMARRSRPVLAAGRTFHEELQVRRRDGTDFWCRLTGRLLDPQRPDLGATWVAEDISDRKAIERRLEDLLTLNATVISATPVGLLAYRGDGVCVLANAEAARMTGGTVEQLMAQNFRDLASWRASGMLAAAEVALATGQSRHLTVHTGSSFGRSFWVEADISSFTMGGEAHLLAVGRDVTAARAAEEALRSSEERYRGLVESQTDFVVRLGRDGLATFANQALASALGRPAETLIGDGWQNYVHPDDMDGTARALGAASTGATARATVENRLFTCDGTRWVAWDAGGICDSHGRVIEVQAVGRDITEWVEHRDQLNKLVADLDNSNRELEQFAYVASHDLREPLRMISNYIALLGRRYGHLLDSDAHEFIGFARDGAKHMDRMVLDLLEFSRVGRLNEPVAAIPLAEAVAEALANLALVIEDSGAVITVAPDLPIVDGWRGELVRLIQNLVGNAVKYRHPERPPAVRLEIGAGDPASWTIAVADNGIGIAPEFFDRIFSIFQRLHTRQAYDGTGIGLAVCRKIVEHHGGRIWVASEPDQGSTFFFTLPRTPR